VCGTRNLFRGVDIIERDCKVFREKDIGIGIGKKRSDGSFAST
jgi:hypothetical protein